MALKSSKWIKLLAVLLSLCMLCCFTGCDKEPDSSYDLSSNTSDGTSEPENYHKVGYIFSGDAESELGFSWLMNQQRIKVSNRCGIDTCYIDNVNLMDFENAVKKLAAEGCTDIVSASSNFTNIVKTVSSRYMNLNFIGYGVTSTTPNMATYTENIYQGAYVAGMVAAYNSQTRNIGVIADTDLLQTYAVTNAVALGSQLVFKKAAVYVSSAHADNEIEDAVNDLINNYSCDVIICYTSSAHSADYCQQRGVKFIGNSDFTGREENYSKMLMYFYCKRDSYFLAQFKRLQMDSWNAESNTGTMGNGAVVVSKALDACEDSSAGRTKEATQGLMNTLLPFVSSEAAYIFGGGKDGELIDNYDVVRVMQYTMMTYSEIYSMNWYVKGVQPIKDYRDVPQEFPDNPLEVKN